MIERNIQVIKERIEEACDASNRQVNDVKIIAVTKSVDVLQTQQLIELGFNHLGENRVDKLLAKKSELDQYQEVVWHFIGNLQRRKVKEIINEIDFFHSLENIKLAEEIQKRAEKSIKCFIEVNVSREPSKHGLFPEELESFILSLVALDKIQIVGLMTMAPLHATEEEIDSYFKQLKLLQIKIATQHFPHAPCTELSMGMSQDYSLAVMEGATYVRIGRALFE